MNGSEVQISGTQVFMGKEIPVILGGFGEGQKVMLAKTIAEIHGMKVGNINQRIKDNRKRFKDKIDIIDLKVGYTLDVLLNLGFNQSQINASNNIYLLSERGYAKLIKIMDTDFAWDIHDKLIDEYFQLREEKRQQKQQYSPVQLYALTILDNNSTPLQKVEAISGLKEECIRIGAMQGMERLCDNGTITIDNIMRYVKEIYSDKFEYNSDIISTEWTRYLLHMGYLEPKRFRTKDGLGMEKRVHRQPTELFYEVFVKQGMAIVRVIDERGKIEIVYTSQLEKFLHTDEFKSSFFNYLSSKYISFNEVVK